MVIPSLILLIYVGRLLRERIKHWEAEELAAPTARPDERPEWRRARQAVRLLAGVSGDRGTGTAPAVSNRL